MTDENRVAYLAGEPGATVEPGERAELDDLRAILADAAVWAEPDAALEDRVVAAVAGANRQSQPVVRRRWRAVTVAGTALAVAAIVVALLFVVSAARAPQEQFRAALAGTSLSPGVSGEATLTKTTAGWRVNLHASGLPRLANGRFYEAWLKNRKGVLVPIGTFNQPTNITLWAGVPPTKFPVVTVTRQMANGNPASSGQRVLVGVARRVH